MAIRLHVTALLCALPMVAVSPHALACGEGMFSAGNGLAYQGFLAPRPATLLVYAGDAESASSAEAARLQQGLERAGHVVLVVGDGETLARTLAERQIDIVIADYRRVEEVGELAAGHADAMRLLPVVPRSERKSPALRERFDEYVLAGASVGQYLGTINDMLAVAAD